ncbi:type III pantothenate kinase [Pedobacter montanisoli]|uniref:Type III pantothenate kinase n=1 Tax=Pedobacter montanisoli TaxID=2923277 RepID=A0ABS9ZUU3_9SPHI|nr:type III pantothenate kinase [Pedobacter montanisoli]MCJ0742012.1 type III pantothenate kinase [Pedobacter montanisoli]
MHNLVIDIGNSYTKIAVFDKKNMVFYQRSEQLDDLLLLQLIKEYEITNATVSSVNNDITQVADLLQDKVNYIEFTTSVKGNIHSYYQSGQTLGLDRWAKVIAASQLLPKTNCLMIDAGTCITYDLLNKDSEYFGGSISLGINMRFKALNHYTGRLPLITWNGNDDMIPEGNNTINAIRNGVLQGAVNEIIGFITNYNDKYPDLKIILTGGDAVFLTKQLKNSIFAPQIIQEPHWVLKGLNEVITL